MADPFVAEIRIFPFTFAPTGWAFCDGQIMPISQNTALFSLLGTVYGGDGKFTSQYDLFDFAHQMRLCDELEAAGLLDPRLKQEWVLPSKKRLVDMLNKGA